MLVSIRGVCSLRHVGTLRRYRSHRSDRAVLRAVAAAAQQPQHPLLEHVGGGVPGRGRVHPALAITSSTHGLTLKALGPIQKEEVIVSLPGSLQLSQDRANDPASLTELIELVPKELWGAKLALKLLYERYRGTESSHAAYIANLPVGFPGVPIFFGKEDLDALEYPPVSSQVIKRCRWLVEFSAMDDVKRLGRELFGDDVGDMLSPNMLGWALSAVTSRAFRPGGDGSSAAAMLPLIDMANHQFTPNAGVSGSSKSSELTMKALRDIAPGEDVSLSYGNLPNDFLLLDYGFIVDRNPHDTVKFSFDPAFVEAAKAVANVGSAVDDMKIQPWQARALDALGLNDNKEVNMLWVEKDGDAPVDERLLAGVRVLCCVKERDLQEAGGLADLGKWTPARSGAWEASVLKTLVGMGVIGLSQFSGSSVADRKLLGGDGSPSSDRKLAVGLRLGKKDLLTGAIEALQARMQGDGGKGKGKGKTKKEGKAKTGKGFGL